MRQNFSFCLMVLSPTHSIERSTNMSKRTGTCDWHSTDTVLLRCRIIGYKTANYIQKLCYHSVIVSHSWQLNIKFSQRYSQRWCEVLCPIEHWTPHDWQIKQMWRWRSSPYRITRCFLCFGVNWFVLAHQNSPSRSSKTSWTCSKYVWLQTATSFLRSNWKALPGDAGIWDSRQHLSSKISAQMWIM